MKTLILIMLIIAAIGFLPYPSSADASNPFIWEVIFGKIQDALDGSSPEKEAQEACLKKIKEATNIWGDEYTFLFALAASESPYCPPIQGEVTDNGNEVIILPNGRYENGSRGPVQMDPCYWQLPECPYRWED